MEKNAKKTDMPKQKRNYLVGKVTETLDKKGLPFSQGSFKTLYDKLKGKV